MTNWKLRWMHCVRARCELVFGDGVALAFWLNGAASQGCCGFFGGPILESRYFGEGAGLVFREGNATLRGQWITPSGA